MPPEHVILVDRTDRPLGTEEKIAAHERGLLHRAVSVFLVRPSPAGPELLLQRRAAAKYHFAGLWTNTCCGHPRDGESVTAAGTRRLREELGLSCALRPLGSFLYTAQAPNGLIENELDHVLLGAVPATATVQPVPDPTEVDATRWIALPALDAEMLTAPASFTPWLAPALDIARPAIA